MTQPRKHIVVIGQRYGTRVVTADLGKRARHAWAELTCDCGHVSRSAIFELVNKGLGCPRRCTGVKAARPKQTSALVAGEKARRKAERSDIRAERQAKFKEMRRTMTVKEIVTREGLTISMVYRILAGER